MFYAKTRFPNKVKVLFDVLAGNLNTLCFTIDKEGMHLRSLTTVNLMLEIDLLADQFDEYSFTFDESIHIGIQSFVSRSLKTMKAKHLLTISITNPGQMSFSITSVTNDNFSFTLSFPTESVQKVTPTPLHVYNPSSITRISTDQFSDMQKLIKNVQQFSVTRELGVLKFTCNTPADLSSETFVFGVEDKTDTLLIHNMYKSEQLARISKITSFTQESSKYVYVCFESNKPMMIYAQSEIGKFNVYFM